MNTLHRLLLTLFALVAFAPAHAATPIVTSVDSIGITVNDLDRAVDFYTSVLGFERVAESEVTGEKYERLYGVFGLRLRIATVRLGDERIELMEFLAPRGRPVPADSKSNDGWFQHVAIIVSDMDAAYRRLREHKVGPSCCRSGIRMRAASRPSISATRTAIISRSCIFRPAKAIRGGSARATCSSASITPQSSLPTAT